jgi:FAD/FMN-containing dehydrogenase
VRRTATRARRCVDLVGTPIATFARPETSPRLQQFVEEIAETGPVRVVGGRTQWDVGRRSIADAREVHAPDGVVEVQASELIVRCGAATTVEELSVALAEQGLQCPLDPVDPHRATVGGVLSVGHSGVRRLRHGHLRDLLLEAQYVSADGLLRRAGAPVVKNVTGFDVCRMLVGSLGTLAMIGEVVLRCQPAPEARLWMTAEADPWEVRKALFRPSSILWDGTRTWVQIEGTSAEVTVEVRGLPGSGWAECGAPQLPEGRSSVEPGAVRSLTTLVNGPGWLAELGTGSVHGLAQPTNPTLPKYVRDMNRTVKDAFDPDGRCNPGVLPW